MTKRTRKERRAEAEVRQAEYDGLTTRQKINRVITRRGNSAKELNRLNIQLNEERA